MILDQLYSPSPAANRAARCAFVLLLSVVPAALAGGLEAQVRPGGVVRWVGAEFDSCGRGSETWLARDGTCWFPIDLLEPEGVLEVYGVRNGATVGGRIRVGAYPYPVQRITLPDSSKVDLSSDDIARVRREQARVKPLWSLDGPARFELPLEPPLERLGPPGSFGSRRYFNEQPRSPHSGADYSAEAGEPVLSVAPGKVVLADDLFFSGKSVFIDHGDGLISMYFHLSVLSVSEGEDIGESTMIGRVGQTGRTTGPHLHFGLRWRGARVDPSLLLGSMAEIPVLGEGEPIDVSSAPRS